MRLCLQCEPQCCLLGSTVPRWLEAPFSSSGPCTKYPARTELLKSTHPSASCRTYAEAEAAGAHLLDFYRALRGPLPNPMPSEANAEMLETLALLELDRRSTAALDAQVREVGGHTVQEWKEVLAMIGCWITLEGARALSEQYHRVRAGSGGGAGAPPWEWTAAQLEKHIKPVQHGVNRCADGAAAQHCALSARQRLLTVRTVLAADVETGHVPAALLGQKEVIAKRALPAQTVADVYGGIYTGSAPRSSHPHDAVLKNVERSQGYQTVSARHAVGGRRRGKHGAAMQQ